MRERPYSNNSSIEKLNIEYGYNSYYNRILQEFGKTIGVYHFVFFHVINDVKAVDNIYLEFVFDHQNSVSIITGQMDAAIKA
ncbi:MAG: hypothetical protein WA941_01215 [Nitrososphaeraceae archaeon]